MLNSHSHADFFTGFNVLFPLFHKESFMVLFDRHYSNDPPINSGWYAAFNMVLAIGCRLRVSHTAEMPDDVAIARHIQTGWMYFQNAASVLTELLLRNTDLMSIQAILGMVFASPARFPRPILTTCEYTRLCLCKVQRTHSHHISSSLQQYEFRRASECTVRVIRLG